MLLEIFTWSSWVNATVSAAMAAFVFMSRPVTALKRYWAATCAAVAFWALGMVLLATARNQSQALSAGAVVNYGAIVLPVFLLCTVRELVETPRLAFFLLVGSGLALCALNWFGLLTSAAPLPPFHFYLSAQRLYFLFLAHLYGSFLYITILLVKAISLSSESNKKNQLRLLALGSFVSFAGGQTTVPMVYGLDFFPLGIIAVPFFVIAVGYGMFRYQFLDFRFAAKRVLIALLVYLALGLLLVPVASPLIKAFVHDRNDKIALVGLSLSFGVFFATGPLFFSVLVKRSFWLKDNLSMGLAHELRSPIGIIQSATTILRSEILSGKNTKSVIDYLEMIERNADRLERFSTDLLEVAATKRAELNLRKESIDGVIHSVIEQYSAAAAMKGLSLIFEKNGPTAFGDVDRMKMTLAIGNLVSNAIKYSDEGDITLVRVNAGAEILISVTDRGIGVRPEVLPKIFDSFAQTDRSRGGHGLGLSIAKNWVEAHGGRIWAESPGMGKGTTVTFTLPAGA